MGKKKGIRPEHANRLERILDRLNAANELKDVNYPGSNLHTLAGDKKDLYAVKVSGNWRLFFKFIDGDVFVVDYNDYH
jgi:toxin HigB-1